MIHSLRIIKLDSSYKYVVRVEDNVTKSLISASNHQNELVTWLRMLIQKEMVNEANKKIFGTGIDFEKKCVIFGVQVPPESVKLLKIKHF